MKINLALFFILIISFQMSWAQKDRKITFVGGARSIMSNSQIQVIDTLGIDSTTAKRNSGGYALIDLGFNIKPNKNAEILGMFRIRNAFGGFWGAGVTFDVRQLYLKGIIANTFRYQLGDLNLKQTPFTLYNHHADAIDSLPAIFNLQRDIVNYEKFYMDNTWRMQGANLDFGLTFKKYVKEINFTGFLARINATNFSDVPERLMGGTSIDLIQSDKFIMAYNFNSVFDVLGTVNDSNTFVNRVQSLEAGFKTKIGKQVLDLHAEIGNSKYSFSKDTLAPDLKDYFLHTNASMTFSKYHLKATLGYLNVAPEYRSIGAQSKDVNYNALPVYYERYTNAQTLRPLSLMDLVSNENIYNRTINSNLMQPNNIFNTALPYGIATFNRVGAYGELDYTNNIRARISYKNLSEIKGQGTLELRKFSIIKANAILPIHTVFKFKRKLEIQAGAMLQSVNRKSNFQIENVDFRSTQISSGIVFEIFKNFELMGGILLQSAEGNEFISERNNFTEVTYYNLQNYDLQQTLLASGLRYNFSSKTYLTAFYQQSNYTDQKKINADYKINQVQIIYNMLF